MNAKIECPNVEKYFFSINKECNANTTEIIPRIKSNFQNQDFDFNAISPHLY